MPGPSTLWSIESGDVLTETTPVTLVWDNGAGLIFRRTIAVDANFMFTTTQSVENTTGAEVRLAPYGIIARHGIPSDLMNFYILHEGVISVADGELTELKYNKIMDLPVNPAEGAASQTPGCDRKRLDRLYRSLLDDHPDPPARRSLSRR